MLLPAHAHGLVPAALDEAHVPHLFAVAGQRDTQLRAWTCRLGVSGCSARVIPVVAPRFGRELEAGVDAELLVHVAEVGADSEGGDVEPIADLPAGQTLGGEGNDPSLGGGQAVPSGRRSLARPCTPSRTPRVRKDVVARGSCLRRLRLLRMPPEQRAQLLDALGFAEQGGGVLPRGRGLRGRAARARSWRLPGASGPGRSRRALRRRRGGAGRRWGVGTCRAVLDGGCHRGGLVAIAGGEVEADEIGTNAGPGDDVSERTVPDRGERLPCRRCLAVRLRA